MQKKQEHAKGKLSKALHFLKSGQFQRALNKAERSLRISESPQAFIIKGLAELRTKNICGAKEALTLGIKKMEPFLEQEDCDLTKIEIYIKACIGLGWCLLKQGDIKKCREYLEKANVFLSFVEADGKEEAKQLEEKLKQREKMMMLFEKKEERREFPRKPKGIKPFHWQPKQVQKEPANIQESKLDLNQQFDDLRCPITAQIFQDPVVALDGFTYERRAIQAWLEKSLTSPMTNAPLTSSSLISNLTLKKILVKQVERSQNQAENSKLASACEKAQNQTIHEVQCSECFQFPIIGVRYKCTQRQNYNLCSKCERESEPLQPVIKFKRPQRKKSTVSLIERKMPDFTSGINPLRSKYTLSLTYSCQVTSQEPEGDVRASSGSQFTKSYFLRNNGSLEWPSSTVLCYVDGDDFNFRDKEVGGVSPGQSTRLQIWCVAPSSSGVYTSFFRLKRGAEGEYFGNRIKCSLIVSIVQKKEAVPWIRRKEQLQEMESIFLEDEVSDISSDPRFTKLPVSVQIQALNLWNMGVEKDQTKFLDLVYSHKFNIAAVANDLFAAQSS